MPFEKLPKTSEVARERKNYLDLRTLIPYQALSDIELSLRDGGEYTLPKGTVFRFTGATEEYVVIEIKKGEDFEKREIFIDTASRELNELDVTRAIP